MTKRTYGSRSAACMSSTRPVKRQRVEHSKTVLAIDIKTYREDASDTGLLTPIVSDAFSDSVSRNVSIQQDSTQPGRTPASSPPPLLDPDHDNDEQEPSPSPEFGRARKPIFAFLRQTSHAEPRALSLTTTNAKLPVIKKPLKSPASKPKKLIQMTIDIGQTMTITCADCGMSYTPSRATDAALHAKHHASTAAVLNVTQPLHAALSAGSNKVWMDPANGAYIVRISRGDKPALRRFAQRVLGVASEDLGAARIEDAALWGDTGRKSTEGGDKQKRGLSRDDRYRVFLYVRERKCVGLLLTERISSAYAVLPNSTATQVTAVARDLGPDVQPLATSAPIVISDSPRPALLGISRIWTSTSARRSGVASQLLNAAGNNFLTHVRLSKAKTAFSQPTDMGAKLARQWFGKEDGWLVYTET